MKVVAMVCTDMARSMTSNGAASMSCGSEQVSYSTVDLPCGVDTIPEYLYLMNQCHGFESCGGMTQPHSVYSQLVSRGVSRGAPFPSFGRTAPCLWVQLPLCDIVR